MLLCDNMASKLLCIFINLKSLKYNPCKKSAHFSYKMYKNNIIPMIFGVNRDRPIQTQKEILIFKLNYMLQSK